MFFKFFFLKKKKKKDFFFLLVGFIVSNAPALGESTAPLAAAAAKQIIGLFLEKPQHASNAQIEQSLTNILNNVSPVVEAERGRARK